MKAKRSRILALVLVVLATLAGFPRIHAGQLANGYKVLAPMRQGNLTVFPVVASISHETQELLTLDEGLGSGQVVVSESGSIRPLVRRRPGTPVPPPDGGGAQVNQLVLVNNSKRPLILLAGEIVTGGKQDRVIGKDRLVPAESDPIDLGVFCVEPGRWVGTSAKFGSMSGMLAAPSVRAKAMADKNQEKVWAEVRHNQAAVIAAMPPAAAETVEVESTSSYARVMDNKAVQKQVDSIAVPIESNYRGLMKQLRDRNAVGVVVAVNGELIWADVFASTELLQKYWPKLVRSYAAEAVTTPGNTRAADEKAAQAFLDNMQGRHELTETEPGLYRHTEISGEGFKAFELTSLLPKMGFDVHIAKMAE
jgi:ARG and Rhodanese-Phosphatase-superfamily-associated Protein domain